MTLFIVPAALIESWWNPNSQVDWLAKKDGLSYSLMFHVVLAGLAWAGFLLFFIIGLQFTTTVEASVLVTTSPLMLVLYFRLTGKNVSWAEFCGVLMAMIGILFSTLHASLQNYLLSIWYSKAPGKLSRMAYELSTQDLQGNSSNIHTILENTPSWGLELLGSLLCLASAASEVMGLLNRVEIKKYVPLFQVDDLIRNFGDRWIILICHVYLCFFFY